jgi:hypothetical protein
MNRNYVLIALLAAAPALANDIDPFGLEKDHFMSDRSRAQVVAELKQAQIAGAMPVAGEVGVKFVDTPSRKTRAQVVAETSAAGRLGLLVNTGEGSPILATPAQERQIELEGLRANGVAARP